MLDSSVMTTNNKQPMVVVFHRDEDGGCDNRQFGLVSILIFSSHAALERVSH
jgi:type VI protein secretion system component VasF